MFDPEKYEAIQNLDADDLVSLPGAEDDRHEYKSSATRDDELVNKISRAASGFWNSGGGLFVAGIDGSGQPDGGLSLKVGRQTRRDWVDQVISRVAPRARYQVKCIEGNGAGDRISVGNAVLLIGFAPSESGPHMAADGRYYIRAGAHTLQATHFIVEAIHARRRLRAPLLRHVFRWKPDGSRVLQLGILCLNDAPALNVEISLDPLPSWWGSRLSLVAPVVSADAPFYFDFANITVRERASTMSHLFLKYRDLADREHKVTFAVDSKNQIGPDFPKPIRIVR